MPQAIPVINLPAHPFTALPRERAFLTSRPEAKRMYRKPRALVVRPLPPVYDWTREPAEKTERWPFVLTVAFLAVVVAWTVLHVGLVCP